MRNQWDGTLDDAKDGIVTNLRHCIALSLKQRAKERREGKGELIAFAYFEDYSYVRKLIFI